MDAEYHTFTVQKDGKIQVDGNVSANATIQVANHRPDMKKEVYNGTEWKQDAQYGVGDTVPYKITIEVPKNIDKLSTFTVTDTPTGLTDNVSSIEVKDDTTDLTKTRIIQLRITVMALLLHLRLPKWQLMPVKTSNHLYCYCEQ